jgi:hypothetical protein
MTLRKVLSALKRLRSKAADNAAGLTLAKRRVAHYKARAKNAENPKNPHPQLLERADKRLHYWRNKERLAYRRRHFLKTHIKLRLQELARLGPHVTNGHVIGGSPEERLNFSSHYAHKHWSDYYSETGAYDEAHSLDNARHDGKRRDCSWWYLEDRRACGLKTINVEPRFTGSILDKGRVVSRAYAETHVGVAVVYGSGTGFHVGKSTGHGPFTWEHGTPTLNAGHFDEFGAGTEVRYRVLHD